MADYVIRGAPDARFKFDGAPSADVLLYSAEPVFVNWSGPPSAEDYAHFSQWLDGKQAELTALNCKTLVHTVAVPVN